MKDSSLLPLSALALGILLWVAGLALSRWRPLRCRWPALTGEWAALGILAALNLCFFWRVLLTRDTWLPRGGGDFNSFYYPLYLFAAERVQAGDFPLWNPHLWGGVPFAANQQAGLFSPFNLLALLVANPFGYDTLQWLVIAQVWLASAFAYAFCRELGCQRGPALIGGVTFAYSGFIVAHLGHYPMVAVAAWLPATLFALRRAMVHSSLGWTLATAGAILLAVLGGHLQILLYLLTVTGLYWLFLSWITSPAPFWPASLAPRQIARWLGKPFAAHWVRCGGTLALATGLALALAAPALLLSLQLARRSIRAALSYNEAIAFSMRPLHLVTLVVPNAFGTTPGTYIDAVGFSGEVWGYAGVIALGLGALAFVQPIAGLLPSRRGEAAFFGGLALLALALALGPATPLQGWFYAFVPGFSRVRASGRWFLIANFAVATLAALGADGLLRALVYEGERLRSLLRRAALGLGVAFGIGLLALPVLYGTLLAPRDPSAPLAQFLDSAAMLLFLVGLALATVLALARGRLGVRPAALVLVVLVVFDLFGATAGVPPTNDDPLAGFRHDEARAVMAREATAPFRVDQSRLGGWQPSWAATAGFDSVTGTYDPQGLATYNRYWNEVGRRPDPPRYDLLNVRYVLIPLDKPPGEIAGNPKFREVARGKDYLIFENTTALPRASLVGRAVPVPTAEDAWTAIALPDFDPRATVYLEGPDAPALDNGVPTGLATIVRATPDALTIAVESDRDAILLLSEVAYPGWRATIDGRDTPLFTANYLFRAIQVPAGRHEVRLVFAPPLWRLGWLIAAVAAALVVALIAVTAVLARRQSGAVSSTANAEITLVE